jgi:hypothetical protein
VGESEKLEQWILRQVISRIHGDGFRISDSAQKDLQLAVRRRIHELLDSAGGKISKEAKNALANEISAKVRRQLRNSAIARRVVRRSALEEVIEWLDSKLRRE